MTILDEYDIVDFSDEGGVGLRIRSKRGGRHFSDYRQYFCRDSDGKLSPQKITAEVLSELRSSILAKGLTEGFIIDTDFQGRKEAIPATNILHHKTTSETSFTSTGEKLLAHYPIFDKLRDTGYASIIRATMTLHQVCASRCQFCSTINRTKKDRISLDEAKRFVEVLHSEQAEFNKKTFSGYNETYRGLTGSDIKLRGLILSGGGQPNLWPYFEEFVQWLSSKDIDLGLITNGFPKNIPEEVYSKFKWIRLSITPEDASPFYPDGKFNRQYIPKSITSNDSVTFGLSYVYGPWTDEEMLIRLAEAADFWNCDYIRVLTDCNLGRTEQLKAHASLSELLYKLNLIDSHGKPTGRFFHQLKYHGSQEEADSLWTDGQCYLQSYNVFWDTTGHEDNGDSYCYPCDSVTVLAADDASIQSARRFDHERWGTVPSKEVARLYREPLRPFFDPRQNCASCLFMKNNQTVKEMLQSGFGAEIHRGLADIEHVNFP